MNQHDFRVTDLLSTLATDWRRADSITIYVVSAGRRGFTAEQCPAFVGVSLSDGATSYRQWRDVDVPGAGVLYRHDASLWGDDIVAQLRELGADVRLGQHEPWEGAGPRPVITATAPVGGWPQTPDELAVKAGYGRYV